MSNKKNRRQFLKRSVTVGTTLAIGGIGLAGCYKHFCHRAKSAANSDIDFSRIAYCYIDCDECPLYEATINNDNEAKMKIAEKWGDSKKPDFKLEEFYCYGCKDKRSRGIPGQDCTVRDCALKKGFATCAQCADFENCDNKLWKNYPNMRDRVRDFKAELGLT
jgi:hypothetical protein